MIEYYYSYRSFTRDHYFFYVNRISMMWSWINNIEVRYKGETIVGTKVFEITE